MFGGYCFVEVKIWHKVILEAHFLQHLEVLPFGTSPFGYCKLVQNFAMTFKWIVH
jgi:hypothetical protein